MITPDYWYCDQMENSSFRADVAKWDKFLYPYQIPVMDETTCQTINVLIYLLIISGAFGTFINFIISGSYILKLCRDPPEFSQSDLLILSMALLDFVSALMLLVGTSMFVNQPMDTSKALIEASCTFVYGGYTLGSRTTYLMMLLIAVTRYVAICRPEKYFLWFSRKKLNCYLCLLLAVGICQVTTQQVVSCHLPINWFDYRGGGIIQFLKQSEIYYDKFKLMWQINAYEKFGLIVVILAIITTLYLKILNHMNNVTPTQLVNSVDENQVKTIRRTFILYLIYLYFIMFPQSGMEMFFTYEFLSENKIWTDPDDFYKNVRLLVATQFIYSSVFVLNPVTVFWLNPEHSTTIQEFLLSFCRMIGIYKLDDGAVSYRWIWQKRMIVPVAIHKHINATESIKILDLDDVSMIQA